MRSKLLACRSKTRTPTPPELALGIGSAETDTPVTAALREKEQRRRGRRGSQRFYVEDGILARTCPSSTRTSFADKLKP
jgi:hypothetical protein